MPEPERIAGEVETARAGLMDGQWKALRKPFDHVEKITKRWTDEKTGEEKSFTADYIGHAVVTDRLLQVDPTYTWEPLLGGDGRPMVTTEKACLQGGDRVGVWGKLTILGVEVVEFCGGKDLLDAYGRCLCRAAMRRGVALDLWIKDDEFKYSEESTSENSGERRQEGGLGNITIPRSWVKLQELLETVVVPSQRGDQPWPLFQAFLDAAAHYKYGKDTAKELTAEQRKNWLFQKAAGAAVWICENPNTPVDGAVVASVEHFRAGWAQVLEGHALEIPDYVAPEPEPSEIDEEAERLADQTVVGPQE